MKLHCDFVENQIVLSFLENRVDKTRVLYSCYYHENVLKKSLKCLIKKEHFYFQSIYHFYENDNYHLDKSNN